MAMARPVLPAPTARLPPSAFAMIPVVSVALIDTVALLSTELFVILDSTVLWTMLTEPDRAPDKAPPNLLLPYPTEIDPAMVKAQILALASVVSVTAPTGTASVPMVESAMYAKVSLETTLTAIEPPMATPTPALAPDPTATLMPPASARISVLSFASSVTTPCVGLVTWLFPSI